MPPQSIWHRVPAPAGTWSRGPLQPPSAVVLPVGLRGQPVAEPRSLDRTPRSDRAEIRDLYKNLPFSILFSSIAYWELRRPRR